MKNIKMRIIYYLFYFLIFTNFIKSAVCNVNDLINGKICHHTSNSLETDKFLEQVVNKIEQKFESLLNEKMKKLEENLNKKFITINDNIKKLEELLEQKNTINQRMFKMDHLLINNMEEIIKSGVDNKHKCSNITLPRSCYDIKECNSNIYKLILPEVSHEPFLAACDLKTFGGGWTIIQKRQDGSENFFRNWAEYAEGFGDVNGEFFIGLNKLHALTSSEDPQELLVILRDFDGIEKHAWYREFKVDDESSGFKLTVGKYSGDAGDSLSAHNGLKFSTKDRDNDLSDQSCANDWEAAWWYKKCYSSNLNGKYLKGDKIKSRGGIVWSEFRGIQYSLNYTQMMIRRRGD